MEKKKFSIELPKGGMSNLAKQTVSKPQQEPSVNATEWQRFTHYLDEFKNVSEHGECVWTVGDMDVERSLILKRIVAMVRFIPYDAVPTRADSIRFYYTGGSGTFDAVAGGWGVVNSEQVQWYGLTHTEKKFEIYTIPHEGDDDHLKVIVNTYRGNKNGTAIVSECEIVEIPVKRNHITTCRGNLFSPVYQQTFNITIDDVWDNDSIVFYFSE